MNMDSEDDHDDYPWADFFMASSNPYYGWVRDLEAAQAVVTGVFLCHLNILCYTKVYKKIWIIFIERLVRTNYLYIMCFNVNIVIYCKLRIHV